MDVMREKPEPLGAEEAVYYDCLLDLIKEFETVDGEMPIQRLKTFLLVMRHPELSTQELAEKAAIARSSMSRNLSCLGELNSLSRKEGYRLIQGRDFLQDRRVKFHSLTGRGHALKESLLAILKRYAGQLAGPRP
jgi:DNA-binding MarR family transcriptional regulator